MQYLSFSDFLHLEGPSNLPTVLLQMTLFQTFFYGKVTLPCLYMNVSKLFIHLSVDAHRGCFCVCIL